jgi:hypothetical protein
MASFFQNILVVFPHFSNVENVPPTHAQAESHPTTGGSEESGPLYFYDSDKPYFESEKLSLAILFSTTYPWLFHPPSSGLQASPTTP